MNFLLATAVLAIGSALAPHAHAADPAHAPPSEERDDVTLLKGPSTHDARIIPVHANGKPIGMRITELHPKSPLKILGLRNGDVILSYQGVSVADKPTLVTEMIEQVREDKCGEIRFKRGKQTRTLKCEK